MKKALKPWLFLFAVLILYGLTGLADAGVAVRASERSLGILLQVMPIFLSVFVFIFLLDLVIRPRTVMKNLGAASGLRGWVIAIAGGVISAGPAYVWFPLLSDLREKGMRTALASAFLYNRAIKLPLLPLMIYYFGLLYAVVLTVMMVLASVVVGLLTEMLADEKVDEFQE